MAAKRKCDKEELRKALETSRSIAEALRSAGLIPAGGNYETANKIIKEFGVDTSHMKGHGWNKGNVMEIPYSRSKPLEEILVKDSRYTNTDRLRRRLVSTGLKEERCEKCGLASWNEMQIPLELNHVNGDRSDHRLENLELLCPNCHAQTVCYRGKNIGRNKQ